MSNGEVFHTQTETGCPTITSEEFYSLIESKGFQLFFNHRNKSGSSNKMFYRGATVIDVDYAVKQTTLQTYSSDPEFYKELAELATNLTPISKEKGSLFALVSTQEGLSYTRIGVITSKLEREHYSSDVLAGYDYVVKQYKTENPFGRISILDGPPGTGKTFMLRGLVTELYSNTTFVVVPPSMVQQLGSPSFIPVMISLRDDYDLEDKNITLILEDADEVLAPRGGDNIASISALLNLGDGLMGAAFDIRIVATTNAKSEDLDEAIMRPGRLCRKIDVNALTSDHANRVLRRISKNDDAEMPSRSKNYTLAEVFAHSVDPQVAVKTKTIGFGR